MYQYKFRPGYGSSNMLIEFTQGAEREEFITDVLHVFEAIDFKIVSAHDLWMNDEVMLDIQSTAGEFELSKDTWGFAFIMANENQKGLKILDDLLASSEKFEKLDVDFDEYKSVKK